MTRPDTHEFALPPDVPSDPTHRRLQAGGTGLALGGLAACGGEAEEAWGPTTRRVRHAFGTTEVWKRLEAVRADQVVFVDDPVALAIGNDIVGVNVVLDEIERALLA